MKAARKIRYAAYCPICREYKRRDEVTKIKSIVTCKRCGKVIPERKLHVLKYYLSTDAPWA